MLYTTMASLDINSIRNDFPILSESVNGNQLVYLDNGATTQKPQVVIDAIEQYYKTYNSNVHRGAHSLSQKATTAVEEVRNTVQEFINAANAHEIIFTKGTTESINLLAYSFAKAFIKPGDEIIISNMEHHSNIVPWHIACEDRGGVIKSVPFRENGELVLEKLEELITPNTKIVAITWVSNAIGTINPIKKIIEIAHRHNIPVMLDAAQAIQHLPVDVQALDVDFLVFSGHKIYAPTGIGVLYGKEKYLNQMPPYQGGGSMIKTVSIAKSTYGDLPFKFEAGTPHISGIIGLGAALRYVMQIGIEKIAAHEHEVFHYAESQLQQIDGMKILGTAPHKTGVISFLIDKIHPFDLGEMLDQQGIAIRIGHHCCQPIMDYYCISGTARASFALYTNTQDIDKLIVGINKATKMLR